MNDVYQHILGLRAIRTFKEEPLSETDLNAVLEAARWTGSSKNSQHWSFVVVQDPEQRQRLAGCGYYTDPVRAAPVTVALVQEPGGNDFDIGRLAQNIMLGADAIGVVSCPVTLHKDGEAAKVLGLKEGAHCRYAITLGYPDGVSRQSPYGGRKPLEQLVHRNRYGD
jgi:nitroreductase